VNSSTIVDSNDNEVNEIPENNSKDNYKNDLLNERGHE
jgi:hypothetical protein